MRTDSNVGARIRALRLDRGLSQSELAGSDLTKAHISRIETGSRAPTLSALIAVAGRLNTSALYLATGSTSGRCPFCGRT